MIQSGTIRLSLSLYFFLLCRSLFGLLGLALLQTLVDGTANCVQDSLYAAACVIVGGDYEVDVVGVFSLKNIVKTQKLEKF